MNTKNYGWMFRKHDIIIAFEKKRHAIIMLKIQRRAKIKERMDQIDRDALRLKSLICFTCEYADAELDHAHCRHEKLLGAILDPGKQECEEYKFGEPYKDY